MQDEREPDETEPDEAEDGAESPEQPDDDAKVAVEAIEGDQGEYVEQLPEGANPGTDTGFDPNRPVRTSPGEPGQQEGVARAMTGGGNEDVPEGGGDGETRPVGDDQSGDEGDEG